MTLGESLASIVCRRDDRPTLEYAAAEIELFPPITQTGKFNCDGSRHFIEPIEALDDGRVREVNVLKPVRGGGSLIGDVHLASVLPKERSPGPYMCVSQTDPDAKMHFCDRTERMMRGNPKLAELLPLRYEWAEIRLTNGHTLYTGGPTISNLQSKGVRWLRLDECWMYPAGRMAEAEARVGDYLLQENSKILRISQAGPMPNVELDHDEWLRAYNRGSIHEWEVACPLCKAYFDPIFSGTRNDGSYWGVTWDHHRLPNGDWDAPKCLPTVRFECPHCRQPMMDTKQTKSEWNRTGRYRRVGEDNIKRKSFHWESVISYPWDELVGLWLDACNAERRGDLKPKLQFYQKRRAIFKDEATLMRSGMIFIRSNYKAESDWPDEVSRYLIFDRQEEDKYWWMARAWAKDGRSRRLGFGSCFGESGMIKVATDMKVPPNHVGVDSGYLPKGDHGVYAICIRNGWIALKGDAGYAFPHIKKKRNGEKYSVLKSYAPLSYGDAENGNTNRRYCPLIRFSKSQLNQKVQELIDSGRWEESEIIIDAAMEQEYSAQMSARIKVTGVNKKTGVPEVFWKEGKNDHARDLANGQVLFAIIEEHVPDPATERKTETEKKELA